MCFLLRCFSSLFHLFLHAYSVYMRHHNANIVFSRSWFLFKLYNVVVVNMLNIVAFLDIAPKVLKLY